MKVEIQVPEIQSQVLLRKLLSWLDARFPYFFFSPKSNIHYPNGVFPSKILAGTTTVSWERFEQSASRHEIVGVVAYDYKNRVESLSSENIPIVDCPELIFWEAALSIEWGENSLIFCHSNAGVLAREFEVFSDSLPTANPQVEVIALESKEYYIQKVKAIQGHIEEGDIYEMNFCQAFQFDHKGWDPISGFLDLMNVSPMPFSAVFKARNHYLISASPERFLKRRADKLIAQPIKGTIRRGQTAVEDDLMRQQLLHSEKERAENLMIVDLMRNDLSKVSKVGTVDVEELFGVHPFPKVHQMISTVSSTLKEQISLKEIFHATFPMGSMTGAPKIKCMELIERYENFRRGWFSGTLGVVAPNGDFDFNVIIRSIVFDKAIGKGYFAVGSAITYDADPDYEYAECQLKASAILEVLTGK